MPEANNQSTPAEQTRVTSIVVERLFNLGNYENVKVGVRVEVCNGDDPGRLVISLENILNDLRAKHGVSDWYLDRAKAALAKPEAELEQQEKDSLDDYRKAVAKVEEAAERRRKAREALSTLDYTVERKDHKQSWDDGDDMEF
jgi:hypothetical protein